ncbi:MAG TPA: glycine--tRNA ligase subunit alpha [Candidatus Saccharimonadales bacterium]|nr:glycine--tRNA ligase subunit alpha [Candidatus Saccharimonadales bacterium]
MNLQGLILALQRFWSAQGCLITQPYDMAVGAGTMSPDTFFRVLGPEPWRVGYVQPSRRPADGRYGENPFRLLKHHQFQVILKPNPLDVQDVYLESLRSFGIDPRRHDVRFEEDNWESPTLGAGGVGWQVLCDGMEITQFTYFQQAGGIELPVVSAELTYGIERICMFLNNIDNIFDLPWGSRPGDGPLLYGEVRREEEAQHSRHVFEVAGVETNRRLFDLYEAESRRLLEAGLYLPAYDACLNCSHVFNTLDARGAIGVAERAAYIQRVRALACAAAGLFLEDRERKGFPLAEPQGAASRD